MIENTVSLLEQRSDSNSKRNNRLKRIDFSQKSAFLIKSSSYFDQRIKKYTKGEKIF